MPHVSSFQHSVNCSEKEKILFGECSGRTCSRCLPDNVIVHIVTLWFNLLTKWKETPGFHFEFPFNVFFSPCQIEWKIEKKQQRFEGKKMNLCKGQSVWFSRILFMFCLAVVFGQITCMCEQLCICKQSSMCAHKGCSSWRLCVRLRVAAACISLQQPQN